MRTGRRVDLLRILRHHARVHILAPIAVGPAVESTFTDGCEIVWNKVRAEFVAFVHHCPSLTRSGLDREGSGIAEASSIGFVRAGPGIDLPHHGPVYLGRHSALGDVAVGPDADI